MSLRSSFQPSCPHARLNPERSVTHTLLSPSRVRHHVYRSIMGEKAGLDGRMGTGGSVLVLDIRGDLDVLKGHLYPCS